MVQVGDDFSFSGYGYDALDRTTEVIADNPGLPTVVLTSEYDRLDGLRSWLEASIGGTADFRTNFAYDAHLRTDWIVQTGQFGGNAVAEKLVDLDYDAADRLTGVTRRAGPSPSSPVVATTTYTPDDQGRIDGIAHALTGGTALEYDLAWNAAGRLAGMTSPDGSVTYGYDDRGQIEAADYDYQTDEAYQYDANGNRLTAGGVAWQTDAYNRVTFDGSFWYEYDAEGNRTVRFVWTDANQDEKIDPEERSQITEYAWDHRNRLVRVTERPGVTASPTHIVQHSYDTQNRWIARSVDSDGDGTADESTHFIYDGRQIVLEFADPDGPGPAAAGLTNRYLWGPAVDQILADEQVTSPSTSGNVLWPLTDHLGSVRDLAAYDAQTDTTTIATHRIYDAFGRLTSETTPTIDHLFAFTARPFDDTTHLQNNHNRWYDAAIGKFLSEDPIGFEAGDANLMRYVGNRASSSVDPDGLIELQVIADTVKRQVVGELIGHQRRKLRRQGIALALQRPITENTFFHLPGALVTQSIAVLTDSDEFDAEYNRYRETGAVKGGPAEAFCRTLRFGNRTAGRFLIETGRLIYVTWEGINLSEYNAVPLLLGENEYVIPPSGVESETYKAMAESYESGASYPDLVWPLFWQSEKAGLTAGILPTVEGYVEYDRTGNPEPMIQAATGQLFFALALYAAPPEGIITPKHLRPVQIPTFAPIYRSPPASTTPGDLSASYAALQEARAANSLGLRSPKPIVVREVGAGVRQWLGEGAVVKRADARGIVIQSKDALRQFRMDLQGHGPYAPHAHLEVRPSPTVKFKEPPGLPHHLYFKDVPGS